MKLPELQLLGGSVQPLLEGSHPRLVMPFSGPNRRVPQQPLDRFQALSVLQQLNAERIAEPVRMRVNTGDAGQACHCSPGRSDRSFQLAFPRPEEIFTLHRHGCQSLQAHGRQANVQRLPRFLHPDHQPAIGVDPPALQFDRVADSQSGVEEEQQKCPRPEPGSIDSDLVVIVDLIDRGEQGFDLLRSERKRRSGVILRRLDLTGRICLQPFVVDAELTERPDVLQLLAQRSRAEGFVSATRERCPVCPEVTDQHHVDSGNILGRDGESLKVLKGFRVISQCPGRQLAADTVLKVLRDSAFEVRDIALRHIDRALIGFPAVQQALGARPVPGADGAPDTCTSHRVRAIDPNRACAAGERYPLRAVRARLYVAAIELKRQSGRVSQPREIRDTSGTRGEFNGK
jgi:hypothetical protein